MLPPAAVPRHLSRWLALLAACAVPLLSQAQSCPSPNADADYILDQSPDPYDDGMAIAMHWPTGLVWRRCPSDTVFNGSFCGGLWTQRTWPDWANAYLPQPFAGQSDWGVYASQNRLVSGSWRMAYKNELTFLRCDQFPAHNLTVFTDLGHVWSGSPDPSFGLSNYAYDVYLNSGDMETVMDISSSALVHLVRGGQPFAPLPFPAAKAGLAGATVTFATFTLAASITPGQAWGGARISGAGSPAFQVNGGAWVQQAIVKSGDAITVRLTAPATGSHAAAFTLRSGQTTGTSANAANGGNEATAMVERTTTFTATFVGSVPHYTKIANNGAELPGSAALGTGASDWACTRDNTSGQIWEVKTASGLRDKNHTYTWYDSNPATNGGANGTASDGTCATPGRCDTEKYAQDVNAAGLCGATDWRMPTKDELLGIVDAAQTTPPLIDPDYFPNTQPSYFWSGSPQAGNSYGAWDVDFSNGDTYSGGRGYAGHVRLVRAGQSLAPVLTGLSMQSVTQTSATVQATSSLDGTGWWLVLPSGSPAPTPAQVKVHASAQSVAMHAAAQARGTLTGLSARTAYDLYFVAYDPVSHQLSAPVQKVQFTTADWRYTKIANSGAALPDSAALGAGASDWACSRDKTSGQIWEVKTTSGLRSQAYLYTWYDSNPATNGGANGTASGGTCATPGRCDTEKYAQDVNAAGLCGATDWRMPTKDELLGIVDASPATPPKIDRDYFPNTPLSSFWSGSPFAGYSDGAWYVNFYGGFASYNDRFIAYHVRLVRAGQSLAPVLTGLAMQSVTHHSATVQAASSLDGTGYWLVLPSGSPAPTPAQVKAHASAQSVAMHAATQASGALTGLSASTAYDLYFVAHHAGSNQLSAPVQKVQFTTAATPVTSVPPWPVTASTSSQAGGSVSCSPAMVAHGGTVTCTATASAGYRFAGWTGACAGQGAICTLTNVTAAPSMVAQFVQNTLAAIPALGEWALAALAGLLGLFSLGALRRRA